MTKKEYELEKRRKCERRSENLYAGRHYTKLRNGMKIFNILASRFPVNP